MTKTEAAKLKQEVRRLVRAEVASSWKGGGDPEDIPIILDDLKKAKASVNNLINHLTDEE